MPKLWLPMKYKIKEPTTGREQIIVIPGAEHLDRNYLKELVHYEEEKTMSELKALGPKPERVYSKKEVGKALNEFNKALRRRQASTHNKIYW